MTTTADEHRPRLPTALRDDRLYVTAGHAPRPAEPAPRRALVVRPSTTGVIRVCLQDRSALYSMGRNG